MRHRVTMVSALVAVLLAAQATLFAQSPGPGRSSSPMRTPWGDPDLQGTYTSDNSIGVPFARPAQFGTRTELTDDEYAAKVKANTEQIARDENDLPESKQVKDEAPNNAPRHWLERADAPSRATSLVVDPPDRRIPPMTPDAQKRVADRQAASKSRGLPRSYADFTNYDRLSWSRPTSPIAPPSAATATARFTARSSV